MLIDVLIFVEIQKFLLYFNVKIHIIGQKNELGRIYED